MLNQLRRFRWILGTGAFVAFVALIVSLGIFRHYLTGESLQYGDANFLWDPGLIARELNAMHHIWRDQSGGISGAVADETQSFILLQVLFGSFGIPLSTVLPLVAFVFVGFIGFRRLAVAIGGKGVVGTIGAAFYVGNPWFWDQMLAGHVSICAATALAPFTLHALLDAYRGKRYAGWLLLGLAAIQLWIDPRTAMLIYPILVVAGIAGAVDLHRKGRRWVPFAIFALAAPLFGVVANAWWTGLYTFAPGGALVPPFYPPIEGETTYGAEADLPHALALSGYFLQFSWQRMLALGIPVFIAWYAAMLVVLGLPAWLSRKNPRPLRTAAITLLVVGLITSMGYHAIPLPVLLWAYDHVPLAGLLREPIKFGFYVALAISVLLVLWLQNAGRRPRWWAAIAVAVVILPIFMGNLTSPDGHGLQQLTRRANFVDMLAYIRGHDPDHRYRTAVLPPWLTEQKLAPETFYVANPFVIQDDIAVIDAKLINTASATDNAAWLAFEGLYRGTDAHPARTLGNFGIRYVIVQDGVTLSPGAAYTAFNVSLDRLHFVLGADPGFAPVYHNGDYWIYEDKYARAAVRQTDGPLIAGPLASATREAVPFDRLGDDIDRSGEATLPAGTVTGALDDVSSCADLGTYAGTSNAYASVGKHEDYTNFWVASDWIIRGSDGIDGRLIARLALPYAFTRASADIQVPITASRPGTLYASLGALGTRVDAHIAVDGVPAPVAHLDDRGLRWIALGPVAAGRHVVSIHGSQAGMAAGKVVVVAGGCPARPPIDRYRIDGDVVRARAFLTDQAATVQFEDGGVERTIARVVPPAGAAAITIDDAPVANGTPFSAFRGVHRLVFLSPDGPSLAGPWTFSIAAPYRVAPGSSTGKDGFTIVGGRSIQLAQSPIKNLPNGRAIALALRCDGRILGSTVEIDGTGGSVLARLPLTDACAQTVTFPYLGSSVTLSVIVPGNAHGSVSIRETSVTVAAAIGDATVFAVPTHAALNRSLLPVKPGAVMMKAHLTEDGTLVGTAVGMQAINLPLNGQTQALEQLRGLRSSEPATAVLFAYYQMGGGGQIGRVIASFDVGTGPQSVDLRIPVVPGAVAIAVALHAEGHAVLAIDSSTLRELDDSADDYIVGVPRTHATIGADLPFARPSQEQYVGKVPDGGSIVGNFTYDPNWTASGATAHWLLDGHLNGWTGLPRSNGDVSIAFGLQTIFSTLQYVGAILVLLVFGMAIFQGLRRRDV
jgi:hypothetical protein